MMRMLVVALASLTVLSLAAEAGAQPATKTAQPPVKTMDITIKSGTDEFEAFVAMPEGKGPFPGIVVIQEWWGLNDWIKENAKHFASKGFIAIAPDLYHGKVATEMKDASQLRNGMPEDRAMNDLKATVDKLAAMDNVQKDNLGAIGWCMGGAYSLKLALNDPRIKSCAMCYGAVVTDPEKLKPLKAKVLGLFGEKDMGIKAADVRMFEQALKTAGKSVEKITIYPEAGHGFMRPPSTTLKNASYNEMAANDAWQQVDAFFANTLKR